MPGGSGALSREQARRCCRPPYSGSPPRRRLAARAPSRGAAAPASHRAAGPRRSPRDTAPSLPASLRCTPKRDRACRSVGCNAPGDRAARVRAPGLHCRRRRHRPRRWFPSRARRAPARAPAAAPECSRARGTPERRRKAQARANPLSRCQRSTAAATHAAQAMAETAAQRWNPRGAYSKRSRCLPAPSATARRA